MTYLLCSGSIISIEVLDEVWRSSFPQLNEGSHLILECVCVWFLQEDIEGMVELNLVTTIFNGPQMLPPISIVQQCALKRVGTPTCIYM